MRTPRGAMTVVLDEDAERVLLIWRHRSVAVGATWRLHRPRQGRRGGRRSRGGGETAYRPGASHRGPERDRGCPLDPLAELSMPGPPGTGRRSFDGVALAVVDRPGLQVRLDIRKLFSMVRAGDSCR